MRGAGKRSYRIIFQRATVTRSVVGTEVEGPWLSFVAAWAMVRQGTGNERRVAAMEAATQPATFVVLDNSQTRTVTETDRIVFSGRNWDIISIVPSFDRSEIEFTATARKA
jgi:head-tail adaptor